MSYYTLLRRYQFLWLLFCQINHAGNHPTVMWDVYKWSLILPIYTHMLYRIAGNFRRVENFVYFVRIFTKIKCTKFCYYVWVSSMRSTHTKLKNSWFCVDYTKIYTHQNIPLYGSCSQATSLHGPLTPHQRHSANQHCSCPFSRSAN